MSLRVYPRECGGTAVATAEAVQIAGLSPRVRGNLVGCVNTSSGIRSIPASAGEPKPQTRRRRRMTVYPRECGGTLG